MAGYDESIVKISLKASGDLSSDQFKCVDQTTSDVAVVAASGAKAIGVLYNKPDAAAKACEIAVGGVARVKAGAVVAKGADVMSNASGLAITATTGKVTIGTALEAAAASGDIIPVLLKGNGTVA